jgi:hypothetical protein
MPRKNDSETVPVAEHRSAHLQQNNVSRSAKFTLVLDELQVFEESCLSPFFWIVTPAQPIAPIS